MSRILSYKQISPKDSLALSKFIKEMERAMAAGANKEGDGTLTTRNDVKKLISTSVVAMYADGRLLTSEELAQLIDQAAQTKINDMLASEELISRADVQAMIDAAMA